MFVAALAGLILPHASQPKRGGPRAGGQPRCSAGGWLRDLSEARARRAEVNEALAGGEATGIGRGTESPTVLSPEICLMPGVPVVRVESAPGNARRIFTGIDIEAEGCNVLDLV